MKNETVTISKEEYNELVKAQLMLLALEHAGVDNWTWYGEAMDKYEEYLQENNLVDTYEGLTSIFELFNEYLKTVGYTGIKTEAEAYYDTYESEWDEEEFESVEDYMHHQYGDDSYHWTVVFNELLDDFEKEFDLEISKEEKKELVEVFDKFLFNESN